MTSRPDPEPVDVATLTRVQHLLEQVSADTAPRPSVERSAAAPIAVDLPKRR